MESNRYLDALKKWQPEEGDGSGVPFLSLKEGSYKLRFLDEEPVCRNVHFESLGKKPVICPENGCLFCMRGDAKTFCIYSNVVDRSDNKVKVMRYTKGLANELSQLLAVAGDPRYYDIHVTRTGKGKSDTRYAVAQDGPKEGTLKVNKFDLNEVLKPMSVEDQSKHVTITAPGSSNPTSKAKDFQEIQKAEAAVVSVAPKVPISDGDDAL